MDDGVIPHVGSSSFVKVLVCPMVSISLVDVHGSRVGKEHVTPWIVSVSSSSLIGLFW